MLELISFKNMLWLVFEYMHALVADNEHYEFRHARSAPVTNTLVLVYYVFIYNIILD